MVEARWIECTVRELLFWGVMGQKRDLVSDGSQVIIACPSHILAIVFFLSFRKRPFLDAGWPLSDGVITSRRQFGIFGVNIIKFYLIDALSFFVSKKVFVESEQQKKRTSRLFFVPRRKLEVLETGFDENRFLDLPNTFNANAVKDGLILFRGGNQIEAGIDTLVKAIKRSQSINTVMYFDVVTDTSVDNFPNFENVKVSRTFLADSEIFSSYQEASITLGQLSNHPRRLWTVPHKFFEAAYFGKPYLTSSSPIMDLFEAEGCLITFRPGDYFDLVAKLELLLNNEELRRTLGDNIKKLYESRYSQSVLAQRLNNAILN
jgi:glycosyltransferase involved in cell wall biosynthesis